jgi:glycosyltransferase involved in cell wall biosynthesis
MAGWAHPRHRRWFELVAGAIVGAGAQNMPMVLSNDPELAVWLRERFPKAFIFHQAQNTNASPNRFRCRFGASVNVAAACSNFAARWNEQYFGLGSGVIHTLYNGVDVDAFRPAESASCTRPVVNFVGKTDPIKGPDLLLMAAKVLRLRTREFSVQIVGRKFYDREHEDSYQRELRRLGSELVASGIEVDFKGWASRSALPAVLTRAHIHVTPSRWEEPFGMTTLEAMACGLATIGSRTGGTPEVIGEGGLLFEREDVAGLADRLEQFVLDGERRLQYAKRARERAAEFSWAKVWKRLKTLIGLT